jgi:serine/threonine-protein kinase
MGAIYEVKHAKLGRSFALKTLTGDAAQDPDLIGRFRREADVIARLRHPNIVEIVDWDALDDGTPCLIMEYLRGEDLARLLKREGALRWSTIARYGDQVLAALAVAHKAGIVHRDLKPHNIFLTDDGTWKVLDFGVALLGDSTGTLTQGGVIGTPTYMAPEQARGEPVDHRADLYALGAIIYRCLTGRVPFVAKDTPALLYAVVHTMPVRPSAIAAVTPHEEAFLAVAMAKTKFERFETAAELVAYFADAARGALPDTILKRARALARQRSWAEPEPVPLPSE